MNKPLFLLVASFPDSLIGFRGVLIDALLSRGVDVHVAIPGLEPSSDIYKKLDNKKVKIHSISLQRTGLNPIRDMGTMWGLFRLMRKIKPDYVLGYTIKPVLYGSIASWLASVPCRFALITGLGYTFTGSSTRKRGVLREVIQLLYRFALTRAHKVFFSKSR